MDKERKPSGSGIEIYLREIGGVPLLPRQEERALARRIRRGDQAAREHMIKAKLRRAKARQDTGRFSLG